MTTSTTTTSTTSTTSTTTTTCTGYTTTTIPVFDLDHITCLVELLYSPSAYETTNKVVLASTIIQGCQYWTDNVAYVVFNNPKYANNLSIRVTYTSPEKTFTTEQSVVDAGTSSELNTVNASTGPLPLYPDEIVTRGALDKHMKPLLDLQFLQNYPVVLGTDFSYSGGGGRFLPKNNEWVKQQRNVLIPGIVELADDVTNNLDIRMLPLRNNLPQGWSINATAGRQSYSYITEQSGISYWKCIVFNYDGYVKINSPACIIADKTKGFLFGGYFTLNPDNGDLSTFSVSLMFQDANSNVVGLASEAVDATTLTGITPIPIFVAVNGSEIPTSATSVYGEVSFGNVAFYNNVTLTTELPQLANSNVVTYPVYKHRKADSMVVSNRNMHTSKGVIVCEFIATHNRKNFYFDTRRVNLDGLAGYFNGGKLGLIINDQGTDYEIQAKWQQQWYNSVISRLENNLPTSSSTGDGYLISNYNVPLASHKNQLAYYNSSTGWSYTTPTKGAAVWITGESKAYVFDGAYWISLDASQEGQSSVVFVWDVDAGIRKIYGNSILLTTITSAFTCPVRTHRVVIGARADNTLHIGTQIIRFVIAGDASFVTPIT